MTLTPLPGPPMGYVSRLAIPEARQLPAPAGLNPLTGTYALPEFAPYVVEESPLFEQAALRGRSLGSQPYAMGTPAQLGAAPPLSLSAGPRVTPLGGVGSTGARAAATGRLAGPAAAAAQAAAAQQSGLGAALSGAARRTATGPLQGPHLGGSAQRLLGSARMARQGLGSRLAAGLRPGALLTKGNLARGLGWGLAGAVANPLAAGLAGAFGAGDEAASDIGRMAGFGVTGAGIGSIIPGVGTGLGALIGTGVGALGFIPGIEDAPIIGGLFGGGGGASKDETVQDLRSRMDQVLASMGADQAFLGRAYRQFDIAMKVAGAERKEDGSWDYGDMTSDDISTLGQSVLEGMIQQFGMEQQNAQSQAALGGSFDSALAEIMAVQSMMQPIIQQQLATAQTYADQYAAAGRAAAAQITDPALAAAGSALATQYSADQASANALAMQQMLFQPNAWQTALEQQYNEQLLALQRQQFEMQQQAVGWNPGLAPGLYPTA